MNKQEKIDMQSYLDFQESRINFWRNLFYGVLIFYGLVSFWFVYLIIKVSTQVALYCPK
jgi:hypothetical protein